MRRDVFIRNVWSFIGNLLDYTIDFFRSLTFVVPWTVLYKCIIVHGHVSRSQVFKCNIYPSAFVTINTERASVYDGHYVFNASVINSVGVFSILSGPSKPFCIPNLLVDNLSKRFSGNSPSYVYIYVCIGNSNNSNGIH